MRAVAIAVLMLVAGTAFANPIIGEWFYVDFDPPNYVHRVNPDLYETVDAYITLNLDQAGWPMFTVVSFRLEITPGISTPPALASLLPGNLAIGDWETGITLASTECITEFPAPVAVFTFVYLGGEGEVGIYDHPEYPGWLVNCDDPGEVSFYCVYSHGGVHQNPTVNPSTYCGVVPVESASWSSIKSLYR